MPAFESRILQPKPYSLYWLLYSCFLIIGIVLISLLTKEIGWR